MDSYRRYTADYFKISGLIKFSRTFTVDATITWTILVFVVDAITAIMAKHNICEQNSIGRNIELKMRCDSYKLNYRIAKYQLVHAYDCLCKYY